MKLALALMFILVAQNPAQQGRHVTGRVIGLPEGTPAGTLRLGLTQQGTQPPVILNTDVAADGRFDFSSVPPGQYTLRPPFPGIDAAPVRVESADVTGLTMTLPPTVAGRVSIEGGGDLPRQIVPPGFDALSTIQLQARALNSGTIVVLQSVPRADGTFLMMTPSAGGDFWVKTLTLPIGYEIKTMASGNINLLLQPAPGNSRFIQITLAKESPAGRRVFGRITDFSSIANSFLRRVGLSTIRSATSPQDGRLADTQYTADAIPNPDGTFEFRGVTSGKYILQVTPGTATYPIEVRAEDVGPLEIATGGRNPVLLTNLLDKLHKAFPRIPPASVNAPAMLKISQSGQGPLYIEGALSYVRAAAAGIFIDEIELERGNGSMILSPGTYELIAYSRGCSGNCGLPGGPQDECRASVTLIAGETASVDRRQSGSACVLQVTQTPR